MPASLLIAGIARSYGCPAITSDLASVNQRLMSPYFGDLAEWLCKAFRVPGHNQPLGCRSLTA